MYLNSVSFYCRVGLPITGGTVNISDLVGVLNMDTDRPERPSLFVLLGEQLGLKLEGQKGQVDVLVIDRAEKPVTEN